MYMFLGIFLIHPLRIAIKGLLNKSKFSVRQSHLTDFMNHDKPDACSKRPAVAPAPARARQDVPFHGQGRRGFGARNVHGVREGERREERQACEREADKGPRTPLADFFNRFIKLVTHPGRGWRMRID